MYTSLASRYWTPEEPKNNQIVTEMFDTIYTLGSRGLNKRTAIKVADHCIGYTDAWAMRVCRFRMDTGGPLEIVGIGSCKVVKIQLSLENRKRKIWIYFQPSRFAPPHRLVHSFNRSHAPITHVSEWTVA